MNIQIAFVLLTAADTDLFLVDCLLVCFSMNILNIAFDFFFFEWYVVLKVLCGNWVIINVKKLKVATKFWWVVLTQNE